MEFFLYIVLVLSVVLTLVGFFSDQDEKFENLDKRLDEIKELIQKKQ